MSLKDYKYKVVLTNGEITFLTIEELMNVDKESIQSIHHLIASYNGMEVYSNDKLTFSLADAPTDSNLEGTALGKIMKTKGFTDLELRCYELEGNHSINFIINFLINGRYALESDVHDGLDPCYFVESNPIYEMIEVSSNNHLITSLLKNNAKVIGGC